MLIKQVKASGLLSFGPDGVDLPLRNLNVLIGPNGSGKSNFLEVLSLLRAAPTNLPEPVKEMGGVREWLWKGADSPNEAQIDVVVDYPMGNQPLRHQLSIIEHGERFEVVDEQITNEKAHGKLQTPYLYYAFQHGAPVLNDFALPERRLRRENVKPEQSILSQVRDTERYPALAWLQQRYEEIHLFRNWSFGPGAALRREQSTHGRSDFLSDGGENLALVLSSFRGAAKVELIDALDDLYKGIKNVSFDIRGSGNVLLLLEEGGGREIPATRLSDGTLRYLCLLAILLHPAPPPLIAIEEPELGLHPDVLPKVAELLERASERTQLVVTTHSRQLVDAFTDDPGSIIVCSKENGASGMDRLDAAQLKEWLDRYSLGQLWGMGELGGNRW